MDRIILPLELAHLPLWVAAMAIALSMIIRADGRFLLDPWKRGVFAPVSPVALMVLAFVYLFFFG